MAEQQLNLDRIEKITFDNSQSNLEIHFKNGMLAQANYFKENDACLNANKVHVDFTVYHVVPGQKYRHKNFPTTEYLGVYVGQKKAMVVVEKGEQVAWDTSLPGLNKNFWNGFYPVDKF